MPRIVLRIGALLATVAAAFSAELDRAVVLAPQAGSAPEDLAIVRWQQAAAAAPAEAARWNRLAWAFVAKARRTLDAGFYKLAEKTLDVGDAECGPTADSRLLRGHVWHQLHRFGEAEAIARALVRERGDPADHALLIDALVERGQLEEADAAVHRLLGLKPGPEAHARLAHLRWLRGDLGGATAAMEAAASRVSPRDAEALAWMLTRLSGWRLQAGEWAAALELARAAERRLADFAPALLARGRACLALGETGEALAAFRQAASLNPSPEYFWWLADVARGAGDEAEARRAEAALRRRGVMDDPRTLALFLATRGAETSLAEKLARAELAHRSDVFSHDALAWALAAMGDLAGADGAMQAALAEGTRDARLALHAGEIAWRQGHSSEAARHFATARAAAATLTPSEQELLARRTPPPASPAFDPLP